MSKNKKNFEVKHELVSVIKTIEFFLANFLHMQSSFFYLLTASASGWWHSKGIDIPEIQILPETNYLKKSETGKEIVRIFYKFFPIFHEKFQKYFNST